MSYRNEAISTAARNLSCLIDQFNQLSTFDAVETWDNEAQKHIQTILSSVPTVEAELLQSKQELQTHRSARSTFRKIIPWDRRGGALRQRIEEIEDLLSNCETIVTEVQGKIDRTPNNKDQQKLLLKELKLKKKELQLEKKQVNSQMRGIREEASVRYANAGTGFTQLMGLSAAQRRDIRINKEAALMPHKNERDFVEHKITVLERQILWVESIK